MKFRAIEIARAVDGQLIGDDVEVEGVAIDSRTIRGGELFVPIVADRDGHEYVAHAVEAGAVAHLSEKELDVEATAILVDDTGRALLALGRHARTRLDVPVIGITGSVGKTSVKDLTAGALASTLRVHASPRSFNNELGVPLTLATSDESVEAIVVEMGARGRGHIEALCAVAHPTVGVVTTVALAHAEMFGTIEEVAAAKAELIEHLPPSGTAVLNADDMLVRAMAARTAARVVLVGESADADVRAAAVNSDELGRARFELHAPGGTVDVQLGLVGEHHVGNALTAAAIALECGMPLAEVAAALSDARPRSHWRMELHERADGVVVLNDAYNANPESMRAALKTLAGIARAGGRRSWAVLGPMAELGDSAVAEHDALGRLAVRLDVSRLLAVGDAARPIAQGAALEGSWDGESAWVPDIGAAVTRLREQLRPGDVVLVKASRSAGLERLAAALLTIQPDGVADE